MKLSKIIEKFITHQQALGRHYTNQALMLRRFSRTQGNIDISDVIPSNVQKFITGQAAVTNTALTRFSTLNQFYLFAVRRGHIQESPMPRRRPKASKYRTPYIYSLEVMRRLVAGTYKIFDMLALPGFTLRPLIILFFYTGLRISEALSLTCKDVDLTAGVLTIRNSKFDKTRWVPIDPKLTSMLESYYTNIRQKYPFLKGMDSAFFSKRKGTPFHSPTVEVTFRALCKSVGIQRNGGPRDQPRIHDFRHTFAIHWLESRHREGADVKRLLPLLSTYMGHVGIVSTQYYLDMTPELLRGVSTRFEKHVRSETKHV